MLSRSFYERLPQQVARELVGACVVWGEMVGRIVETEAYAAVGDEACHTAFRPSARRFVEEKPAGTAYVYLNYGMHWMLNVLTKHPQSDGFVLIRALEPLSGLEGMRERRGGKAAQEWCSGPGKLTRALGITGGDHGRDLCGEEGGRFGLAWVGSAAAGAGAGVRVVEDVRVGIRKATALRWRFLWEGSPYVSVALGRA